MSTSGTVSPTSTTSPSYDTPSPNLAELISHHQLAGFQSLQDLTEYHLKFNKILTHLLNLSLLSRRDQSLQPITHSYSPPSTSGFKSSTQSTMPPISYRRHLWSFCYNFIICMLVSSLFVLFAVQPYAPTLYPMPYALVIYSYPIVLLTLCPDSDYSDALDPEL